MPEWKPGSNAERWEKQQKAKEFGQKIHAAMRDAFPDPTQITTKDFAEALVRMTDDASSEILQSAESVCEEMRANKFEVLDNALSTLPQQKYEDPSFCRGLALAYLGALQNPEKR